jgi:hypothetical protein
MGFFSNMIAKLNAEEKAAMNDSKNIAVESTKLVKAAEEDIKSILEQKRSAAIAANGVVNEIKKELQQALIKARDLHLDAVKAAQHAQNISEADIAKFKLWANAHQADVNTLNKQIIPTPVSNVSTGTTTVTNSATTSSNTNTVTNSATTSSNTSN